MNAASENFVIDVQGLVKKFGSKVAVNQIDLQMPKGQVWGFLGPNGSGKTTTLRMICGLLKIDAGQGRCLGFDIQTESNQIKRATGYMTQKFSFWGDLSIRENLEFVARLYQLNPISDYVDQTLDNLGLTDRQHQLADALSGGWKQRLALAAVTMHKPQLLLLDEPTAGVDPQARRDFWDEIHDLSQQGLTVLVSTHYMDEAERCDQIVYLAHGELITKGPVKDITKSSGLIHYQGYGDQIRHYLSQIQSEPGVMHSAFFGSALHISGTDRALLKAATEKYQTNIDWQEIPASLEDVFIELTQREGKDRRQF